MFCIKDFKHYLKCSKFFLLNKVAAVFQTGLILNFFKNFEIRIFAVNHPFVLSQSKKSKCQSWVGNRTKLKGKAFTGDLNKIYNWGNFFERIRKRELKCRLQTRACNRECVCFCCVCVCVWKKDRKKERKRERACNMMCMGHWQNKLRYL